MTKRLAVALAGRYSVERELGGGGMSRVFIATETELGRSVVIKVIAPELDGGASAERFAREVKLDPRTTVNPFSWSRVSVRWDMRGWAQRILHSRPCAWAGSAVDD